MSGNSGGLALCGALLAGSLAWGQPAITEYPAHTHAFGIALGADGALWFAEGSGIGRITTAGVITDYPIPGASASVSFITAGPDGALWFTELGPNAPNSIGKIGRITTAGAITEYVLPTPGAAPYGITPGPDGALWFAELSPIVPNRSDKIGRITTAGAITEYPIPTPGASPYGITTGPDGALWFTESENSSIGRITTAGAVTEYATPTPFSGTRNIAAGPDGALWFTESNKIGRITTAGVITEYALAAVKPPDGITTGPDGALWFAEPSLSSCGSPIALCPPPSVPSKIGRITTAGVVSEYPLPTPDAVPSGVATGPDGAVWFTETGVTGLQALPRLGAIGRVAVLAPPPPGLVQYPDAADAPQAITTGPDGALWFIGNGIGRITTDGVLTEILPAPAVASSGIVTGPDGALWFGDYSSNSIGRITTAGALTEFPIPTPNSHPSRIAAGPDGALWFTESGGNKIGRVTVTGAFSEYPIPTANSSPFGITAGPDGALWFTEAGGSKIGRITTAGSITEFGLSDCESPGDITVGPDGALWFTAPGIGCLPQHGLLSYGAIGRITTAGILTDVTPPPGLANPEGITLGSDGALWIINFYGLGLTRLTTSGAATDYAIPNGGTDYGITTGPDGALWFAESSAGVARIQVGGLSVPTITPEVLSPGGIGVAYFGSLHAAGGVLPYQSWSGGNLPPGLTLDFYTGAITGVPIELGTFNFGVTVQDSGGSTSARQSFSITITQAPACTYLLNADGQIFSAAGGSGSIKVNAAQGCPWTVSGAPPWVTITSAASLGGSGSVSYVVAPNSFLHPVDATLTVAGLPYTVQEAASLPEFGPGFGGQLSLVGSMPHLAAEGGWTTTFTFINKGTTPAVARTNLFAPDGTPLVVPVDLPQQPATSKTVVTSSLDQTIAPNASFVMEANGPFDVPYVEGSAQLAANGNVDGFAIFHFGPNNQEAVVPMEKRNAPSYILVFDNTNGVLTGVALENVSPQPAAIPMIVRDDTGTQIAIGSIPLNASGHISFVLSTQFPGTANVRGTVEFDTPLGGQISVLGIRYTPPGTLTTIPALANVGTTGGTMAHLAAGDGWETTFVLVNSGDTPAQANLQFFDDNGSPVPLPLFILQPGLQLGLQSTASSIALNIAAGASSYVQSAGPIGSALLTGSAQLTTTGNVSGFAIFRYNPNGQEAVVPLETRNASSYLLAFDNTNGTATGVAVSDISTAQAAAVSTQVTAVGIPLAATLVPVILRDEMGAQIGVGSIPLPPNGHTSFMLASQFPATAGIRGTVEFDTPVFIYGPSPQISVLGIRSPPALTFTTLPALAK